MSKDKMKGYKQESIEGETQEIREQNAEVVAAEKELHPDLQPEEGTVVPTGDEEMPISGADPRESRKALYDKARKNREDMVQREATENVDVDMVQRMQAEASGGEADGAELLDTNRKDRTDEWQEENDAAKLIAEQQTGEPESTNENSGNEITESATDALTQSDPDAKVVVKIAGKEYSVPQQDIDDAGGIELYQKARYTNMRLERIATLGRALEAAEPQVTGNENQQDADPPTGGLDEADIIALRERVVDAMVDGDDLDAVDKVLQEALSSGQTQPKPSEPKQTQSEVSAQEQAIIAEAQAELEAQYEDDRIATNDMMRTQYSDIMKDAELLELAQQRFAVIASNPENAGRTQKELARESAEYVRSVGRRLLVEPQRTSEVEQERQRRIERKRVLPRQSSADAPAPSAQTEERKIPTRREHFERLRKASGNRT